MSDGIVIGMPPAYEEKLLEQPNGRMAATVARAATTIMRESLQQAIDDVRSTPEGRDVIDRAIANSQDGIVYIYAANIRNSTSGVHDVRDTGGASAILVNPCDGHSEVLTEDGTYKRNSLRGIVGHEFEHIAQGDHRRPTAAANLSPEERTAIEAPAIRTENAITAHFGEAPRRTDNYDRSGRIVGPIEDVYSCGPETFSHNVDPYLPPEIQTAYGPDQGTMITGDPALPRQLAEASGEAIRIDPAALPPLPEQPAMDVAAVPTDPSFTATARI